MVPQPWLGFFPSLRQALVRRLRGQPPAYATRPPAAAWELAAARRRNALLLATAMSALLAAGLLGHAQGLGGFPALHVAQVALYTLLFAWVTAGCVTAVMGFMVQWRGDPHMLSAASVAHRTIQADARTAIIMPICNEQVSAVFAGLRATCESLAATGATRLFDVFVLSDTSDPALRAAELAAWKQLRDVLGDDGTHVYYRWRQRRSQRKAGNVADFCRRWGRDYRYMVVLDADSVMSGDCLLSLVRLMEAHPRAGILQTAPQACGLSTLHARAQQFAGRVAGRLFAAGMQYWQLGESHYWGHNAIIRVEPFMRHCALAPLPGRGHGRTGAEILSHDFIEAALMRRAGYQVWLVPDLPGSYEQQPPNLLEELRRDRRWCEGNLRNARLIAEPGLHPVHRAMLATGVMAYLSAPLWLAFVLFGAFAWLHSPQPGAAHAIPLEMMGLWACTVTMLALPRVLGVVAIALKRELPQYGGAAALVKGALLEGLLSVLQAPVRMAAHSLFVVAALSGLRLEWKSPPREATSVTWGHAARRFAPLGAGAAALLAALLGTGQPMAWWFLPVALPLLLATPLAVLTSRASLGERARARGLLLTPEELGTPTVLRRAWVHMRQVQPTPRWLDVVTDPWLFKVVCQAMGPRDTAGGTRGRHRSRLVQRLVGHDAQDISPAECMRLMSEPQSIAHLRARLVGAG